MSWRQVTGYGLIAGVSVQDQRRMRPGCLCDLYIQRQRYDDIQHKIRREQRILQD